jgi:hypothetical protein
MSPASRLNLVGVLFTRLRTLVIWWTRAATGEMPVGAVFDVGS